MIEVGKNEGTRKKETGMGGKRRGEERLTDYGLEYQS
jgi:hypothetical protein